MHAASAFINVSMQMHSLMCMQQVLLLLYLCRCILWSIELCNHHSGSLIYSSLSFVFDQFNWVVITGPISCAALWSCRISAAGIRWWIHYSTWMGESVLCNWLPAAEMEKINLFCLGSYMAKRCRVTCSSYFYIGKPKACIVTRMLINFQMYW